MPEKTMGGSVVRAQKRIAGITGPLAGSASKKRTGPAITFHAVRKKAVSGPSSFSRSQGGADCSSVKTYGLPSATRSELLLVSVSKVLL